MSADIAKAHHIFKGSLQKPFISQIKPIEAMVLETWTFNFLNLQGKISLFLHHNPNTPECKELDR